MLWKRPSKPASAEADETANGKSSNPEGVLPGTDPHVELENALEALAGVFRALGRHAYDLPDAEAKSTAEVCERWATHLLERGPVPEGPWDQGDASTPTARREFVGAVHYATHLRRTEHSYLNKSLYDLRQAVWIFVHELNQTLSSDGESTARLRAQLSRLNEAARSSSTADLQGEAIDVTRAIGDVLDERQRRQAAQVATLGETMAMLGRALEEVRREVGLDPLTRLCNRKAFNEQIARVADLSSVFKQPACLLLVDVDHFKAVNLNHGHPAGDEVLRRVSASMVHTFRRRNDVVARFGGDEFAIILRETELKEGILLSERLLDAVRSMAIDHDGASLRITVSIGMCQSNAGESSDRWVERADRALHEAKAGGRDRVAYSVPPS
jgi:diguanylate cyclase (GGDEF)-like protein